MTDVETVIKIKSLDVGAVPLNVINNDNQLNTMNKPNNNNVSVD